MLVWQNENILRELNGVFTIILPKNDKNILFQKKSQQKKKSNKKAKGLYCL